MQVITLTCQQTDGDEIVASAEGHVDGDNLASMLAYATEIAEDVMAGRRSLSGSPWTVRWRVATSSCVHLGTGEAIGRFPAAMPYLRPHYILLGASHTEDCPYVTKSLSVCVHKASLLLLLWLQ